MSTKAKTIILLAAIFLTLLEFNLITCSGHFCEFFKAARGGDYLMFLKAYSQPPDVVVTASLKP